MTHGMPYSPVWLLELPFTVASSSLYLGDLKLVSRKALAAAA